MTPGSSPIIGTELYQAYEHRTERPARRSSKVDDSGGEVEGGRKAYYHLTALAETLTGYRNLIQLSSRAYLEGYYQKPKVDWELLEDHHEGIIATTGCLGGQVLQALLKDDEAGALAGRGPAAGHLRARQPLRRAAGPRHRRPAADEPEADGDRAGDRRAAARDERQPLHAPGRRDGARRAAVRADQREDPRGEPLPVPRRPALPEVRGRDAHASSTRCPEACDSHAVDRRAGGRRARVRQPGAAELPGAGGPHRDVVPARAHVRGASRSATGTSPPPVVLERLEYELGVIESMGFSAYFLIVWDIVRYAKSRGHPRRSGPGERGGLVRRVLPAHRRHRPDQVRPAVRAVPQPGPQADARHRHGLRLPLPRRDDQVRRAALRRGPRRPDRHVLDDQGAGRGARRGAGARLPVRRSATRSPSSCRR